MIVAEVAFLRRCRIEPEHHKHNTRSYDEAHGGVPPDNPAPKATKRVTVGSVPPRVWNAPYHLDDSKMMCRSSDTEKLLVPREVQSRRQLLAKQAIAFSRVASFGLTAIDCWFRKKAALRAGLRLTEWSGLAINIAALPVKALSSDRRLARN
jgi:hypothetical protein